MKGDLTSDMSSDILSVMDIKSIREGLGLTQEEFARKIGVSWSTVARWERGKAKPSLLAQRALHDLLRNKKSKGG